MHGMRQDLLHMDSGTLTDARWLRATNVEPSTWKTELGIWDGFRWNDVSNYRADPGDIPIKPLPPQMDCSIAALLDRVPRARRILETHDNAFDKHCWLYYGGNILIYDFGFRSNQC
jgi:hypothetical protein